MTPLTRILFWTAFAGMIAGLVVIAVGLFLWHPVIGYIYSGAALYWLCNCVCETIQKDEKKNGSKP